MEKPYRYMPSQRVWFVDLFGPKTGINFSLESRWFSSELRERMSVFIVSILNEKDRNRNMRIRNAFEQIFGLCSNLSNHDIISA